MAQPRWIRTVVQAAVFAAALGMGLLVAAIIWRGPTYLTPEECAQWQFSVGGVEVGDVKLSKGDEDKLPNVRARIRNGTSEGRIIALHVALLDGEGQLVAAACLCQEGTGIVKPGEAILRIEYLPISPDDLDHVKRVKLRVTGIVLEPMHPGTV